MRLEPRPHETFDLRHFTRNLIITLIEAEDDPTERRARIRIAQRDGHLSAREAQEWIDREGL